MNNKIIETLIYRKSVYQRTQKSIRDDAERRCAELQTEIDKIDVALATINDALEPLLCKHCCGSGETSFTDAAGSRDTKPCQACGGTGIRR